MKAFLSHATADKPLVEKVFSGLERSAAWLDRAEIEWGELFLEKITAGIEEATDFVLFWSSASSKSEWVKLELHMAFIRALSHRAIRLKLIVLDKTPIPLYLRPFQFLDASAEENPAAIILDRLRTALAVPAQAKRQRFLNRHTELSQIENAVDNRDVSLILLHGFQGIGKRSLALEAFKKFFAGASTVEIEVSAGTDFTELALKLNTACRGIGLPVGLTKDGLKQEIALSLEELARARRAIIFANIQHWLTDNAEPNEILSATWETLSKTPYFKEVPAIFTCTRRVNTPISQARALNNVHISGLDTKHIATLLKTWYGLTETKELSDEDAYIIAPMLLGQPIAAKLAAGIVAQFGAHYLKEAPHPIIKLRHDVARSLLQEVKLTLDAERVLECLSLIRAPVPAAVLSNALGITEERFHAAIDEVSRFDFLEVGQFLSLHPLIADYYWYVHWRREDYKPVALSIAKAVWAYAKQLDVGSTGFSDLLPVAVRLYALGGEISEARNIRSDLVGELLEAAIQLYNRRDYPLAESYLQHVLDTDSRNHKALLYKARILIRREDWKNAEDILDRLQIDRPYDKAVRHAQGWMYLRRRRYDEALKIFLKIIETGEYGRALRDAAEALHHLDRSDEALIFLQRAKNIESENPFILDLEARILQEKGKLPEAYEAARLALIRNPKDWAFQHRVGQILQQLDRGTEARSYYEAAVELGPKLFTPLSSLVGLLLDEKTDNTSILTKLKALEELSVTQHEKAVFLNLKARSLLSRGDRIAAQKILEEEVRKGHNLSHNLRLMVQIYIEDYEATRTSYPASAAISLGKARTAVQEGSNKFPHEIAFQKLAKRLDGFPKA